MHTNERNVRAICVVAYVRESARREEVASARAREQTVRAFCEVHDYELVRVVSEVGGGAVVFVRTGALGALALLTTGDADLVMVAHWDRSSRDVRVLTRHRDHLMSADGHLAPFARGVGTTNGAAPGVALR